MLKSSSISQITENIAIIMNAFGAKFKTVLEQQLSSICHVIILSIVKFGFKSHIEVAIFSSKTHLLDNNSSSIRSEYILVISAASDTVVEHNSARTPTNTNSRSRGSGAVLTLLYDLDIKSTVCLGIS